MTNGELDRPAAPAVVAPPPAPAEGPAAGNGAAAPSAAALCYDSDDLLTARRGGRPAAAPAAMPLLTPSVEPSTNGVEHALNGIEPPAVAGSMDAVAADGAVSEGGTVTDTVVPDEPPARSGDDEILATILAAEAELRAEARPAATAEASDESASDLLEGPVLSSEALSQTSQEAVGVAAADAVATPPVTETVGIPLSEVIEVPVPASPEPASALAVPPAPPAEPPSPPATAEPPPPASPPPEEEEGATMTIIEHLEELRKRLTRSAIAVVVCAVIGWFLAPHIVAYLQQSAEHLGVKFTSLTILGPFSLEIKLAFMVGIILSSPFTFYQVWAFVAPGLTRKERHYAVPFSLIGSALFALGATVGVLVVPLAIRFLVTFFPLLNLQELLDITPYIMFITVIATIFGITFELPIFMVGFSLLGIVNSRFFIQKFRIAIFIIFGVSMVITPGADFVSPIILGVFLVVLYWFGVLLIRFIGR